MGGEKMAEGDYSQVALILGLIGGILILLIGAVIGVIFGALGSAATAIGATGVGMMFWVLAIVGLLSGIIVIVGSVLIKNPKQRVLGSVLVLVFSIIAIFTAGGGLFIGSILGIVAGVLGLVSKTATA
ncbi:MAG: hypothetical protein JXB14_00550 [Candidatus Altiarchaeota archaeon]|nr:hypothetical protein [Candidatus Altiarchaeota archaeon]